MADPGRGDPHEQERGPIKTYLDPSQGFRFIFLDPEHPAQNSASGDRAPTVRLRAPSAPRGSGDRAASQPDAAGSSPRVSAAKLAARLGRPGARRGVRITPALAASASPPAAPGSQPPMPWSTRSACLTVFTWPWCSSVILTEVPICSPGMRSTPRRTGWWRRCAGSHRCGSAGGARSC